jgi:preprotein translocase subunit Sss1
MREPSRRELLLIFFLALVTAVGWVGMLVSLIVAVFVV